LLSSLPGGLSECSHDGSWLGAAGAGVAQLVSGSEAGATAGLGAAGLATAGAFFFFAGAFLALDFLALTFVADFFGAAAFAFLADFFADFLAFFADLLAVFFEDFFADFFFAVRIFLFFLAFLPFLFFLPLAIVILLCCRRPMSIGLFESSASRFVYFKVVYLEVIQLKVVRRKGGANRSVQSWPGTARRPIEKLNCVHYGN
jgi:hypothetical protein